LSREIFTAPGGPPRISHPARSGPFLSSLPVPLRDERRFEKEPCQKQRRAEL
jgi:hypothetical protein